MPMKPVPWIFALSVAALAALPSASGAQGSIAFFVNDPNDYDYGLQLAIPQGFGDGEFTLEVWLRPEDSFPFGPTSGGPGQLTNWSDADVEPYSGCCWWFDGNFLLDGHNNGGFEDRFWRRSGLASFKRSSRVAQGTPRHSYSRGQSAHRRSGSQRRAA